MNNLSSWFTVRFARWCWRLVWNRRMAWTLVWLVSLTTLYYQWENWRSARELEAAHQRLIDRVGTDDLLSIAPPKVPDSQNFLAIPVMQQWETGPLQKDCPFKAMRIPPHVLLPKGFVAPELTEGKEGEPSRIDFVGKAINVEAMNRALGDGNGLLPQIAEGLQRPFSALRPGLREALEFAGENPYAAPLPNIGNVNDTMRDLALHLRCAAAAGDVVKTQQTAMILLRWFPEGSAREPSLVASLVSIATHELAFDALHDSLRFPSWQESDLLTLQRQLAKFNDLEVQARGLIKETLQLYPMGLYIREQARRQGPGFAEMIFQGPDDGRVGGSLNKVIHVAYSYGPVGWHDANIAFCLDGMLDMLGPPGETAWIDAAEYYRQTSERVRYEYEHWFWSPRRYIGAIALPNIGNVSRAAAECLFQRRCLIIACALERYRLKHGVFPTSLDAVQPDFAAFKTSDPAQTKAPLGYHLEKNGYLLWSAGEDARDDGGVPEKDWLWRLHRQLER